MSAVWLDWDGRTLRWNLSAAATIDLYIDGIRFERVACGEGVTSRDFDVSLTGNDQLAFSLFGSDGALLLDAWRVSMGETAQHGVDAWSGDAPRMRRISSPTMSTSPRRLVAIVIPVFNAAALVRECIEAVIRWTSPPARLIVIDDASTDADVETVLAAYRDRADIEILRNAQNLAYTRTSNIGIERAGDADVVLLNSDTQVGPRWLDRLHDIAYTDDAIGTVTAVSDNAGAFTVPDLETYCPIPARWSLEQTQRALLQNVGDVWPELPTGNGFCLYIKRAMLDRVGVLDAEAFPMGYGEENDLCQRAERAGFRHLIAGDVFVAHARSASFGDARRAELGAKGMAVLRQRYPDYEAKVGATLFGFARRMLDYRVRRIYADRDGIFATSNPRPRALMLDDTKPADARFEIVHVDANTSNWDRALRNNAIELICVADDKEIPPELAVAAERLSVPIVRGELPPDWNSARAFGSVR